MEELAPIVLDLARKYTSGDSSSVTYEAAETLMEAVIYTINEMEESPAGAAVAAGISAEEAYRAGYARIIEKVDQCRKVYNEMIPEFDAYENEFYYDTVAKGLPAFFIHYDARFRPQDHILTLDYLTLDFDPGLTGIDQIEAYLRSTVAEQRYLRLFPRESVIRALEEWNRGYRKLPVNIAEIARERVL